MTVLNEPSRAVVVRVDIGLSGSALGFARASVRLMVTDSLEPKLAPINWNDVVNCPCCTGGTNHCTEGCGEGSAGCGLSAWLGMSLSEPIERASMPTAVSAMQ